MTNIVRERHCRIADKKQHRIGMLPQAAQQIEGYGLLGTATLTCRLGYLRVKPLPLAQDRIVVRAESSDVFGGKCDPLVSCRLAKVVGIKQKILHPLGFVRMGVSLLVADATIHF
jgi:hypothetical protein